MRLSTSGGRACSTIRATVNQALEVARQNKDIGSALSAHVSVRASGDEADLLARHLTDLPMIFITSSVALERVPSGPVAVAVEKARGGKCPRCWRLVVATPVEGEDTLCDRCKDAVVPA